MFLRGEFFGVRDCFALLGVPRRPRVDAEELKAAYLRLSAEAHPDAAGGDAARFREIQEAHRVLRHPASRLRHLLEVQFGAVENLPPSADQEMFLRVGAVLQRARDARQRRDAARSALARALLVADESAVRRDLEEAVLGVEEALAEADSREAVLDANWPAVEPLELARLASDRVYLMRWKSELAEGLFRLAEIAT